MAALTVEEFRLPAGEQAVYEGGLTFPLALQAANVTKESALAWLASHKSIH